MSEINRQLIGARLKERRELAGLTQEQVGNKIGRKFTTVAKYESGEIKNIDIMIINIIANLTNTDIDYFLLKSDSPIKQNDFSTIKKSKRIKIPILGYVRAGTPLEAVEEVLGYEEIPEEWTADGSEYFCLAIKGDSMFPFFIDGDRIIVKKQNTCENGEIAVVLVDGNDATVKEVKRTDKGITLIPYNRMYPPMGFTNEDIINKPVTIIGIFQRLIRDKI